MNDRIDNSKQLLDQLLERHPALIEAYDSGDLERLLFHMNLVFLNYDGPFLSEDIIQVQISGDLEKEGLYFFDLKGLVKISMPVVAGKYGSDGSSVRFSITMCTISIWSIMPIES